MSIDPNGIMDPTGTINRFEEDPTCIKCGASVPRMRYRGGVLTLQCFRCQWTWQMSAKDEPTAT